MKFYLSKSSMICAIGDDNDTIMQNLAQENSGIKSYDNIMLAKIDELKNDEIFKNLKPEFKTRTNQILYLALKNLDDQIKFNIQKYGKENIAVIIGTTNTGVDENFKDLKAQSDFLQKGEQKELFMARNSISNPANFVRELYGLSSLAYSVSTACTSGIKTIIEGMYLIKNGICKAVICGGTDGLNSLCIAGFKSLDILSDEKINPFSLNRKGTNLGEGACVFVLSTDKSGESVEILAAKTNNDAFHITKPSQTCDLQKILAKEVLKQANLSGVDYVNLHGTGTVSNDTMESLLIKEFFKNTPVSSTKSLMGHTLGAAGAIELGICAELILASRQGKKVPLPVHSFDKNCEFEAINFVKKGDKAVVKTALSSSFAFGGDNAMMILGECDD
ncbi:MAG: beta-ACP synthase [Campylobacter sp.]|nr:beta-ACP synthase [Campylobacter sp.]